jgi:lactoylglutathione lyase
MMKIDHIAVWVKDLEKMKNFHVKYFGCTVNDRYENPTKQFSSYFLSFADGARIELMHRMDIVERGSNNKQGLTHIAFKLKSHEAVKKLTTTFAEDGFTVEGFPRVTGDGYYESVILDPENNRLELVAE